MGHPTKVVTSLNEDGSLYTIEIHEPLNPVLAAAMIDAPVVESAVYADEGGTLYVVATFGGEGVPAKVAELSKPDVDKDGNVVKSSADKVAEVFAADKKKREDAKAAEKAKADAAAKKAAPAAKPAAAAAAKDEEDEDDSKGKPVPGKPLHPATPGRR